MTLKIDDQLMTRILFCPTCFMKRRPEKRNSFMVFGHTRQYVMHRKCHHDGIPGYTPHIIMYSDAALTEEYVTIHVACCMDGCGISLTDVDNATRTVLAFEFIKLTLLSLPVRDVLALRDRWKNSGYEII